MSPKALSLPRLDKNLAGYTLLGAAAFMAPKAHADSFTYVAVNQSFDSNTSNTTYNLDLSGIGSFDIEILASAPFLIASDNADGAQILLGPATGNDDAALAYGATIDPNGPVYNSANQTAGWGIGGKLAYVPGVPPVGYWPVDGSSAYLGFYFVEGGQDHAGWIDISTTIVSPPPASGSAVGIDALFTINSYAYDNTPGDAITAGGHA